MKNDRIINAIASVMSGNGKYDATSEAFARDIREHEPAFADASTQAIHSAASCAIQDLLRPPHNLLFSSDPAGRFVTIWRPAKELQR